MKEACPRCKRDIRLWAVKCDACGKELGYRNIRAARRDDEVSALGDRYQTAEENATSAGCEKVFRDFEQAIRRSKAVVCCKLSEAKRVLLSDDQLFATFYQLVQGGLRLPNADMDQLRSRADDVLFPYYKEKIHFAALSLNGQGAWSWGNCSLTLRSEFIEGRASVFEENSLSFWRKHLKTPDGALPPGYRACWDDRHRLVAAKLGARLKPTTQPAEYPKLLLSPPKTNLDEDFVEVHVYGPLARQTVERIVFRKPKRRQDRAIVKELGRKLKKEQPGIAVETVQ